MKRAIAPASVVIIIDDKDFRWRFNDRENAQHLSEKILFKTDDYIKTKKWMLNTKRAVASSVIRNDPIKNDFPNYFSF